MPSSPRLIFIVGPTGSGKSRWAAELAENFPKTEAAGPGGGATDQSSPDRIAEARPVANSLEAGRAPQQEASAVLNTDSVQLYEGLNIGSAKPDFRKTPHIPHFLFDIARAPQVLTAGDFRRKALQILRKEAPRRMIFAAGGSGFYIQALEKGMLPLKSVPELIVKELSEKEKARGLKALYEELRQKDPKTASNVSEKDRYRILRALAVIKNEGRPLSEIKAEKILPCPLPFDYRKIGLHISKNLLGEKIRLRVKSMLKKGLLDETEDFVQKGFADWRPLQSLGYKECLLCLQGRLKKEDLEKEIVRRTLQLAKKQNTWFRRDKSVFWRDCRADPVRIFREILEARRPVLTG